MAVFEALPDEPIQPNAPPEPVPAPTARLGNGEVTRAVVKVLVAIHGPMRAADIHLAVERLLERPVSKESVHWCLRRGISGEHPRFERVSYGMYRLR